MRVAAYVLIGGALWAAPLAAHDASAQAGPSRWDVATMGALAAAGVLYAVGSRRLTRRGARVRALERVSFWIGWAALAGAVAPPLDRASAISVSMHMAQHELLMRLGAPLLIVGRPIVPWLWSMPDRWRPRAGLGLRLPLVRRLARVATTPLVAWALHGVVVWTWHVPALYEWAVRSEAVHAAQHAMFVGTALLFWWGLVQGRYGRAAYGASVFYVFLTMVHTGVLGAAFALSTRPFYHVYGERAAAAGIDAVADQQLAGLVAWVPAGMLLMVSGLTLFIAWLAEAERRTRQGAASSAAGTPPAS
jgi:putative membrane protein